MYDVQICVYIGRLKLDNFFGKDCENVCNLRCKVKKKF